MEHSCIHIYCGDGKGKTTAAIGQAVRAKGAGLRCVCCFFLKSGSSEIPMLHTLGIPALTAPHSEKFIWDMTEVEKEAFFLAQHALFQEACSADCDVLILDELLDAYALGIVSKEEILALLNRSDCEMVLTGRDGTDFMVQADYYTQMSARKHPYNKGIVARKGIEF